MLRKNLQSFLKKSKTQLKRAAILVETKFKNNPIKFLFVLNAVLIILIILNVFLQSKLRKQAEETSKEVIKETKVFRIGTAPKIKIKGEVSKDSKIVITALTSGLVKNIYVKEGDFVKKGKVLARLSSNYWGANLPYLQKKIAEEQYNHTKETYDTQKQIIEKNKELVNLSKNDREKLREISKDTISQAKNIVNLNNEIINTLDQYLKNYEATNNAGINESLILSTKQLKSQYLSANYQIESSLRQLEYQANEEEVPNKMAEINDELLIKQIELQEKALELQLKLSKLQYQIAKIQASLMYPSAVYSGSIEKVYIKPGQLVQPGTPLFLLSTTELKESKVTTYINKELAANLSLLEEAAVKINPEKTIKLKPYYISKESVQGDLFAVYFLLPEEYNDKVSDKQQVEIELAAKLPDTSEIVPFIPLESVFLLNENAYVLVVSKNNRAEERKIELGEVIGGFVAVKSGLSKNDQVILNRNISAGEKVKIMN